MDRFGKMKNSEISEMIDENVRGKNAIRNRNIMKLRIIEGMTFEKIAEECDMSTCQVRRIFYKLFDEIATSTNEQ